MKKLCLKPGCNRIANPNTGHCDQHYDLYVEKEEKRKEYLKGAEAYRRKIKNRPYIKLYNSAQWRRMSNKKLSDEPICQICEKHLSTAVDHIEPHRGDLKLFFNYNNLQALCKKCHSKKTAKEQHEKQKNDFY